MIDTELNELFESLKELIAEKFPHLEVVRVDHKIIVRVKLAAK